MWPCPKALWMGISKFIASDKLVAWSNENMDWCASMPILSLPLKPPSLQLALQATQAIDPIHLLIAHCRKMMQMRLIEMMRSNHPDAFPLLLLMWLLQNCKRCTFHLLPLCKHVLKVKDQSFTILSHCRSKFLITFLFI